MERFRFIDADAHVFEPEDIWDNYLEKKFQGQVTSWVNYKRASEDNRAANLGDADSDDPIAFGVRIEVNGEVMPSSAVARDRNEFIAAREPLPGLGDAYEEWAKIGFPAGVYKGIMDNSGIDYMILYPTVGLWSAHGTKTDAELGAAIRRAYNSWLGDFCKDAGNRVFGAASIDLRDPETATLEVRRCVKEYGFKAIHLNPTPVGEHRLYESACDPLWAECADLGIAVGVHPGAGNSSDIMLPHYFPGLRSLQGTVAFSIGNMFACGAFIMGGVLERHPELKLVFLESGSGWAAYWPERLESSVNGGSRGLKIQGLSMSPAEYFQRQCFVSAEQDDPGIKLVIETLGDECITTGTDFSHPEGRRYGQAVEHMMELPDVSLASKKKILFDNPNRAYGIE